jgi:hypothetical protein
MIFEAPERPVTRVFIHCSADDSDVEGHDLVELITGWHLARSFSTIGYHFILDKTGAILPGRDLELIPAAQKGNNTGTIAICAHGLVFPEHWTKSAQAGAVINLCAMISTAYAGLVAFWAHNEVNSNKTCPVFDHKALLGLDRWRRMP